MLPHKLSILGTRGIPARHGGFETFAERLALYLTSRGHEVSVYCQERARGAVWEDRWQGIRRIHIPVAGEGAWGTIIFDWKAVLHAARERGCLLTLGYNTAAFSGLFWLQRRVHVMNMDGLEWKRKKWGPLARLWLFVNERIGGWTATHLIADHPEIQRHLATRAQSGKIHMIPYGADRLDHAPSDVLSRFHVTPGKYALLIARPEPENNVLEIVAAYASRHRGMPLVVLGNYEPESNPYHEQVLQAASSEVMFAGALYEKPLVDALRFHSRLYVHGHTVGGTNPSLVEALGAGLPVLAHENPFNRWVAGEAARYFEDGDACCRQLDMLLHNPDELAALRGASRQRHAERFTWDSVLEQYETLLLDAAQQATEVNVGHGLGSLRLWPSSR